MSLLACMQPAPTETTRRLAWCTMTSPKLNRSSCSSLLGATSMPTHELACFLHAASTCRHYQAAHLVHHDLAKVKLLLVLVVAVRNVHALSLALLRFWIVPRHLRLGLQVSLQSRVPDMYQGQDTR